MTATLASTFCCNARSMPSKEIALRRVAISGVLSRIAPWASAPRVRLIAARYLLLPPNHALAEVSLIR